MEDLQTALENAEQNTPKRYTLWTAVNNLEEIREMCEDTIRYAGTIYKSMAKLNPDEIWEIVARVVSDVIINLFKVVDEKKEVGKSISTKIGDFMTITIEHAETLDADKDGTFNPMIEVGPELQYDNVEPKNNALPDKQPMFDPEEQTTLDFVCKNVQTTMKSKYGVMIEDYKMIEYIFTSFLRTMKQYMIEHKDDNAYGCDISLGETINVGLTKYDQQDGSVRCCIGIEPGRIIKMEYAKSDEKSEKQSGAN